MINKDNEVITPGIFLGYLSLSKLEQLNWCSVNRDNLQTLTVQENKFQIQGLWKCSLKIGYHARYTLGGI